MPLTGAPLLRGAKGELELFTVFRPSLEPFSPEGRGEEKCGHGHGFPAAGGFFAAEKSCSSS